MSRAEYTEDIDDSSDQWRAICWRGAVTKAINGKRGQAFLRELIDALDAMPEKVLIAYELIDENKNVCALGAVGVRRGTELATLDSYNHRTIAETFGIADALVREIEFMNDEVCFDVETGEQRWRRMRAWAESQLKKDS